LSTHCWWQQISALNLLVTLLLASSAFIGIWAFIGNHRGILFLQFFYATAGIIGMIRWF
jgi:hypothetical protein